MTYLKEKKPANTAIIFISIAFCFISIFFIIKTAKSDNYLDNEKIIAIINSKRQEIKLKPLKTNKKLEKTANAKIDDMKNTQYFSHKNPQGQGLKFFLDAQYYKYLKAGEVLAINYSNENELIDAWMSSPDHKKTILRPDYQDIGVSTGLVIINNKENIVTSLIVGQKKQ